MGRGCDRCVILAQNVILKFADFQYLGCL